MLRENIKFYVIKLSFKRHLQTKNKTVYYSYLVTEDSGRCPTGSLGFGENVRAGGIYIPVSHWHTGARENQRVGEMASENG